MPDKNRVGPGSGWNFSLTICKLTTALWKPDKIRVETYFRNFIPGSIYQIGTE